MHEMTKEERVRAAIIGGPVDRPPVALWRHFPGDDQRPGDLARATLQWQRAYDFDLVKVSPSSSFCLRDWGVRDEWKGTLEGTRDYTHHPIQSPDDWYGLRVLNPDQGGLGAQLDCLRQICAGKSAAKATAVYRPGPEPSSKTAIPLTLAVSPIGAAGATCVQLPRFPSPTSVRQICAPLSCLVAPT